MPRVTANPRSQRFQILFAICIVVAALYLAREVLMPLSLAVLLSFLLTPLCGRLERWGLGRIPSVVVVVGTVGLAVTLLGWVVAGQVLNLAAQLPQYTDNIIEKVDALRPRSGVVDKAAEMVERVQERLEQPATTQASTQATTEPADVVAQGIAAAQSPVTPVPSRMAPRGDGSTSERTQASPAPPTTQPSRTRPLPVEIVDPKSPMEVLGTYLGFALETLGTAGIVAVFVIFILLQREDLRDRLIRLVSQGQLNVTTQALDDAAGRISRYLLAQSIVNGTYGVAVAIGLWTIGALFADDPFPNVVLWGLLCALLRFIPYIGPWIAAMFPLAVAFAVYKGFGVFVAAGVMFVIIELISNNAMEPWLYGSSTGMSAVAVLVSAVFWTWLWGPVGLLMATPLTSCLVVMGKYVPQLRFLDILLGDEPVLEPPVRVYQRLLAQDADEVADLVEEFAEGTSLLTVYDDVLIPALNMAERDRHAGRLDEQRTTFIRQTMSQLIDELAERERLEYVRRSAADTEAVARTGRGLEVPAAPGPDAAASGSSDDRLQSIPKGCVVNVLCLPSHDEVDAIIARMLAQQLELRNYCTTALSETVLASEMVDEVEKRSAHAVVVSALPPAAVTHARYLCKRLHARYPTTNTVVGLWTASGDLKKATERIACTGSVRLTTTLRGAIESIHQMVQPIIIRATSGVPAETDATQAVAN